MADCNQQPLLFPRCKGRVVGAVVLRNTRRVQFLLSGAHPRQDLFALAAARLKPG